MSTTVTYKNNTLTTVNNQTKTLKTAGKYLEDDITLVDISGGVEAVSIVDTPDAAGGTVRTITAVDISDTTATAADVAQGKYFYTADGTKTAGTASGGGGGSIVIDLSEIAWEIGAVQGTTNKTYEQNKQTSNVRLRPVNLLETKNIPFVFTCNWGNGEWFAQYQTYNELGKSTSQFTGFTDDFTLPSTPYICIVLRHSDGSLPVTLADIDTIKPKLVLDPEVISVLLGG